MSTLGAEPNLLQCVCVSVCVCAVKKGGCRRVPANYPRAKGSSGFTSTSYL